jgi:putative effector of murein hydrolase LrgA (UPF0299 family)
MRAFIVILFPAGLLAHVIFVYAVNIPYMDQWVTADVVAKAFEGTISLSDLTFQQNETKPVFPRLFFIALAYLTNYDVRYEMWGTFGLACLVTYNIYYLGKRTLQQTPRAALFLLFLASLMIFSLFQWENWFWGIQMIVFVPIACISTILALAYSPLSVRKKFIVSTPLAIISSFSYANGLLCWIVPLPVLWEQSRSDPKNARWGLSVWGIGSLISAVLYFYNYVKPSYHPSFTTALIMPLSAAKYFLAFLGAPLANPTSVAPLSEAAGIGLCLAVLFLLACGIVWRYRHDPQVRYRALGWIALGSYTLISGMVTMLGRLGLGVNQALSSRYGAFSFPLIVALIYLVPIVLSIYSNKQLSQIELWKIRCTTILSTLLIVFHLGVTTHTLKVAEMNWRHRLQGKFLLLFVDVLPSKWLEHGSFPDLKALKRYARGLDRNGLLSPGLRKSLRIESEESGSCGWFDILQQTGPETYLAQGWGILPRQQEAADGIVLAYENKDGGSTIFGLVEVRTQRPDVAQQFRRPGYVHAGWAHSFTLPSTEERSAKITAWAFDATTGALCRLTKAYLVERGTGAIRAIEEQ